ncbi:MAG: hypothetical protein LBI30_02505 [Holosporales bacterium]|jgi:hypothetical protein|nr:hypothetical protein [Holosporales bacterium]
MICSVRRADFTKTSSYGFKLYKICGIMLVMERFGLALKIGGIFVVLLALGRGSAFALSYDVELASGKLANDATGLECDFEPDTDSRDDKFGNKLFLGSSVLLRVSPIGHKSAAFDKKGTADLKLIGGSLTPKVLLSVTPYALIFAGADMGIIKGNAISQHYHTIGWRPCVGAKAAFGERASLEVSYTFARSTKKAGNVPPIEYDSQPKNRFGLSLRVNM